MLPHRSFFKSTIAVWKLLEWNSSFLLIRDKSPKRRLQIDLFSRSSEGLSATECFLLVYSLFFV